MSKKKEYFVSHASAHFRSLLLTFLILALIPANDADQAIVVFITNTHRINSRPPKTTWKHKKFVERKPRLIENLQPSC